MTMISLFNSPIHFLRVQYNSSLNIYKIKDSACQYDVRSIPDSCVQSHARSISLMCPAGESIIFFESFPGARR